MLLAPIQKSKGAIVPFAPAVPRSMISVKVADTNHESRGHKPSRHVEMFATKSVTRPRQTRLCRCNGI